MITRIRLFRNNAFERELASGAKHGVAAGLEMLDKAQMRILGRVRNQFLQSGFPVDQRLLAQVFPSIEQEVECEIDQVAGVALRQRCLQCGKVRGAVVVERTNLPVYDTIGKRRGGVGDLRILGGPIQAFTGFERHIAIGEAHLNSIAVKLDLVQPVVASRRAFERFAELRRDEVRQVCCRRCRYILAGLFLALVGRKAVFAVPDSIGLNLAACRHERYRLSPLAGGDLLHLPAGCDRGHVLVQDGRAVLVDGMIVVVFDQQPVGPLAAVAIIPHAHQDEAAMQALAMEHELEITLLQSLFR